MSQVKDHYDHHLGSFYSWMIGDFQLAKEAQKKYFTDNQLLPIKNKIAMDLGAGNGIQSIALAELGFIVKSIDFHAGLLDELSERGFPSIKVFQSDLLEFDTVIEESPELIICMGDTITHLSNLNEVARLLEKCYINLLSGGKLILSFRDLTLPLEGVQRFIPVRSDNSRIHTCFLEYFDEHVMVYDILHQYEGEKWQQKVSSYPKLRLSSSQLQNLLTESGFKVLEEEVLSRMIYLIAEKS